MRSVKFYSALPHEISFFITIMLNGIYCKFILTYALYYYDILVTKKRNNIQMQFLYLNG